MNRPHYLLETVIGPNLQAFEDQHDDERLAVNAILSLDMLFGVVYRRLCDAGHDLVADMGNDDKLRKWFAERNRPCRIVRDMAAALKHGSLTHPNGLARLVTKAENLERGIVGLGDFMAGYDECGDAPSVYIETNDGPPERCIIVVFDAHAHILEVLKELPVD